jgi:WD40 repeat protein
MATVVEDKIKFIAGIIAHTQSVNCISSIGKKNLGMFLTGSTDKTVKFWKPDSSTV